MFLLYVRPNGSLGLARSKFMPDITGFIPRAMSMDCRARAQGCAQCLSTASHAARQHPPPAVGKCAAHCCGSRVGVGGGTRRCSRTGQNDGRTRLPPLACPVRPQMSQRRMPRHLRGMNVTACPPPSAITTVSVSAEVTVRCTIL